MNRGREYNPPPPFFSKLPSPFSQIHHSTYVPSKHPAANAEAKGSKAQMAWLNTSEAKQRAAAAKAHAIFRIQKALSTR